MRKLTTMKVLTTFMLVLLIAGFAQAQFLPSISGKVTVGDNNDPVANFKILLSLSNNDTLQFHPVFVETDEMGNFYQQVVPNLTYTLAAIDTFSYEPFSAQIAVGTEPVVYDIKLNYRQQDATISGTVTAEDGSDVGGKTIYLLKLPDELELSDSLMIETHYEIPHHLVQWASYKTEIGSDGSYSIDVLFGKYVVYVEAEGTTLAHWGLIEVNADLTFDFMLREKKVLSGHIENVDGYDFVRVSGFSLNRGRPFSATPDANGDYTMDVAPGKYVVRLTATFISDDGDKYLYAVFYDSVYRAEDATLVDVQDDTYGIDFTLPPAQLYPFTVSGTVTSAKSGNPIADATVSFVSFNPLVNVLQWHAVNTDKNGEYTYAGKTFLQEDSLIGFAYADGFFGEFYDDAATHVNATPIVYHPNEDISGIDFALDTLDVDTAYAISGTLYDENGKIVGQGTVTAFTNATNVGVVTVQVDSNGHYDFGALFPAGSTVYLQAWGGYGYVINIYDNAESWADATPVVMKNDVTIDFVMK
ncbi:MAG TPA: carboxypeptidase regulatory-like domain-containing protein, partial [Calditrichaeota bacterium]|nr:carboxypeptidase regulatory-like domain-containing protein [Calditrichota bacterium]